MPPKAQKKPAAPKKLTKPSAKSKTGNTACSQAASNWQLAIRGKEPLDPQTYATLAKCRAMTRTAKQADDRARMGYNLNEQGAAALKGRLQKRFDQGLITQKSRDERLKMLLQQRKEKQAAVAAKPVTQTVEKLTGTRAVAQRFENAKNKFVEHAMNHAGLTRPQAVTALNAMTKAKAVKIDPVMGQFSFTHGAFGDKAVIRRAAGIEPAKPADKNMTSENKIPESKQVQAMKNKLERMKGQFDSKFEDWSSQTRGHGGTPFIMDNSKGRAQYKRHQKGNESLSNLNKAIKEQEEKIQAAEYRHIGRHTQTKKSEKFVEKNPVSPGLQYLEQKGLVKSWPKKPEFHFVQGMDKTALITVDGRVGVARKYNGGTDEKFLAAKKLASIANSYNRTQSLVSSVRQKPGYGVARASAAGNRELVGLKMRDKGQVTTQPAFTLKQSSSQGGTGAGRSMGVLFQTEGTALDKAAQTGQKAPLPGQAGLFEKKPAFSRQGQPASKLPPRTADTMSEAIALSSPNGRMSKRTKDAATKRLSTALFGPNGLQGPQVKQPTEIERLRRDAANLRDLASRGLKPRAHAKLADQFEARAIELEKASAAPKFSRQGQLAPGRGTEERRRLAIVKLQSRRLKTNSEAATLIQNADMEAKKLTGKKRSVFFNKAVEKYQDIPGMEAVYKPYGENGRGFYLVKQQDKSRSTQTPQPKPFSRGGQLANKTELPKNIEKIVTNQQLPSSMLRGGQNKRGYVAKIKGPDPKYKLEREFVKPVSSSPGGATYNIKDRGIYETQDYQRSNAYKSERTYELVGRNKTRPLFDTVPGADKLNRVSVDRIARLLKLFGKK